MTVVTEALLASLVCECVCCAGLGLALGALGLGGGALRGDGYIQL